MDKKALETAVSYAWDDLGNAAVLVNMAAKDYVKAAQNTLDAFNEVQRQLTTIFMQNLSLEQAGQLMAELRKQPAGQMTVAFAEDTQLQAKLKSANDGKQAYRDARHAWRQAVEAAEAEGCEPTERFSQPDEVVDADQAIEAEAQITERLNALRAEIEQGARHVDTMVLNAQQSASVVPQAVPAAQAAPTVEAEVITDSEAEDPLAMLDGMTGNAAAAAPAAHAPAASQVQAPRAQPAPIVDDIEEDESLPPPNSNIEATTAAAVVSQRTSDSEPTVPMSDVARRMTAELLDNCIWVAEAMAAINGAPRIDLPNLVSDVEAAMKALRESLANYTQEILEPDPDKVQQAEQLVLDASNVVAHAQRLIAIGPLIDKSLNESKVLQAAAEAYEQAQDTKTRAVAGGVYKQAVEALMATHAQLVASGNAPAELLESLGELVDHGGVNLAKMANHAHVAAVSPRKDAHDMSWANPAAFKGRESLARFAKPAVVGLAALVVVIAGVWIGSSGGQSSTSPIVPPVVAPATVPASVAVPAPAPAPIAVPAPVAALPAPSGSAPVVQPAKVPAPDPVKPAAPVVVKPTAAPTVHRPVVVHHIDNLAREQAQLNAANAKLDAWAKAQNEHP
ncbi:hypothetical protein [Burkholderia gladioli]|uniref:hypothetical protein n=1 Tax=Burkholderia gladioli TaxID=28095 RepID=UPI001641349F|nr:hypothetical protein [Burkholderia gladioli]